MRKIYLMLAVVLALSATNSNAQCTGQMPGRYTDQIFPTINMTSVKYGTYTEDSMDIYEPAGDTSTMRPIIILGHGGSFIGGSRRLDAGSNTDPTVDTFCLRFARRGYVTVSIDYRLGGPLSMAGPFATPASAADVVAKAISDGKAAIRYLVQNRTTYKIDTNNIFIGGNSAGAVLYMHVGYITNLAECTPLMLTALTNNGGMEGNSGNPGYTTKCKGVINMAGALAATSLVTSGDIASVNCQGDLDNTVPYNCDLALGGGCPDSLCGLGALEPEYLAKGIYHMSRVFPAQSHVPWSSNAAMMNTVDSLTTVFLYSLVCTNVASVNAVRTNTEVSLFPNPATDVLNLSSKEAIAGVTVLDQSGRVVMEMNDINNGNCQLNTSRLSKGMYIVRVKFVNDNNVPVVRKVVIQ